jgi:hypothetical protein
MDHWIWHHHLLLVDGIGRASLKRFAIQSSLACSSLGGLLFLLLVLLFVRLLFVLVLVLKCWWKWMRRVDCLMNY